MKRNGVLLLAVLIFPAGGFAADPTDAARLEKAEAQVKELAARVQQLEAMLGVKPAHAGTLPVATAPTGTTTVYRMAPAASAPQGWGFGVGAWGGSCANGQCVGGQCANGQCGGAMQQRGFGLGFFRNRW